MNRPHGFARSLFETILRAPVDDAAGGAGGGGGDGGAAASAAAAAAAEAAPASAAGGDKGGAAADWTAGLDDGAKALLQVKGWKSPAEALKGYSELETLVGVDKIAVPGKDAKPEDWTGVFRKLGMPESADKYQIPARQGGDYTEADKAFQGVLTPILHKAGITQRQLEAIVPAWNEMNAAREQGREKFAVDYAAKTVATLTQEFGGEEAYAKNFDLANRAFKHVFGDQALDASTLRLEDGSYLSANPLWVKAFAKLGASIGGDGLPVDGKTVNNDAAGGPSGALRDLAKIYADAKADPKHAYVDAKHPEHAAMLDRVMKLTNAAFGQS